MIGSVLSPDRSKPAPTSVTGRRPLLYALMEYCVGAKTPPMIWKSHRTSHSHDHPIRERAGDQNRRPDDTEREARHGDNKRDDLEPTDRLDGLSHCHLASLDGDMANR